ncbi:WD40 YVTN repeat-like-containing domain [Cordyceps militaris]|uniref:Protein transport protein SEC31 n=1 Tax=Cordyceps militaris TaxID=73501 RepID=A0A2H4SU78_CORMI|nr:WD40 YVTN repeat-like-containing domain [Cordyceps militaris]
MVRLRDIPRTATFAWSPSAGSPLVVTGTRAGAVDADFSDESKLELWDLSLDDQEQGLELQPIATIATDARFYDIAWSPPDSDHPRGIIAGAMENGSLDLWDAAELQAGGSGALISQTTKHSGPIKTLQFNPLKPQILATAGAKGEIYIYDVNDIANPFRLGNAAARSDDIECLAWNRKVSHILATGGAGGFVTVWDLKTKKASLTLNNSRKAVSAIAWDPNNSTKLLTGTPDDNAPVILLWDLRNSNAPERTLQGHEQGILSLSWCSQDSSILLSSGKDNKTIVWNPLTGERYGELPEVTNWTFQTRFHPQNPNLSATASFDGKITIQTLQNTNPDASKTAIDNNLDGADFFSAAQTQPQGASWSLSKAPKWFERPIGASFGFGGKIVIFKPTSGQERSSKVVISQFSADSDFSSATEKFQEALASGDLSIICEERMQQSKTDEEKADWKVMQTLIGENPRGKIVEHLGLKGKGTEEPASEETKTEGEEAAGENKKLSSLFDGAEGEGDDDDFLAGVTATKGAKTDNPFHLFADSDTTVEKDITKALMLGDFAKATEICLKEDRIADAFLIANCGGQELVDKVQAAYLARKTGSPSYIRLLGSVIEKNLWDVVYNADLQSWKETMAIICTFSDPTEFSDLCEALGDRIHESGERKDASFCYLVGSRLEKVVSIWTAELEEAEQASTKDPSQDSTFSVHARTLQSFIEKVTVFRQVSKFVDNETNETAGWKLAALYDKYTEYADILAGHGQLDAAQRYLDLLPSTYPAAEGARSRVKQATQKSSTKTGGKIATRTSSAVPQTQSPYGYPTPQPQPLGTAAAPNLYSNINSIPTPQQFQPLQPPQLQQLQQPSYGGNPYQPSGMYQPHGQSYTSPAPPPISGPPRSGTPALSTMHSAPKDSWNDVPIVTKAAPSRRSTPSVHPPVGPYGAQAGQAPPGPPTYGAPPKASPPPPPPKGSAPPRVTSPLAGPPQTFQEPPRPSSAANQYAPPPPQVGASPQMTNLVARTASPYNAPPAGAPPSNRYAPAPAAQQTGPAPPAGGFMSPPPAGSSAPPANPYSQFAQPPVASPAGNPYAPTNNYGAPHGAGVPHSATGPPTGPPPMGRPGPPLGGATPTPPPPRAAATPPLKAKHPPGDRTHIPASAQRLVEILTEDVQRVAAKAPPTFAPQVKDTQKRLSLLFDHLNNEELVSPYSVSKLSRVAEALKSKDYAAAAKLQAELQRERVEECGQWMVGLKRLINMSKATP